MVLILIILILEVNLLLQLLMVSHEYWQYSINTKNIKNIKIHFQRDDLKKICLLICFFFYNNLFSIEIDYEAALKIRRCLTISSAASAGNLTYLEELIVSSDDFDNALGAINPNHTPEKICDFILNICITIYQDYNRALCYAARFARLEIVKHLLTNFNKNISKDFKEKALLEACRLNANKVIFFSKFSPPNIKDMYFGCESDYIEIIQLLINQDIDLNVKDITLGYTPLMCAIICATFFNQDRIIWFLLINGADPNITNKDGKNFFDYAKHKPNVLDLYEEFIKQRKKIIFDTISKENGFDQNMLVDLVDLTNNYF